MKLGLLAGAALVTAVPLPALAVPADFPAKAEALLRDAYPATGPGAAVIVVEDGKAVFKGGQGLADIDARRTITPDTVFRLGSITKQFSAAVMLQLVSEGKVSLDDKLSKFLPGYPEPGANATIAQLLNHTVGVQSYTGIPGFMDEAHTNKPYTTEQMIALFRDLPSPSKPGERWQYNNSGYVLVGAVIEKVTGKPWHVNVEERISRPLGLTSIRYGVMEADTANMAKGYSLDSEKVVPAKKIHMSVPHAAGALIGTVEDLAKWNEALNSGKVIPPELFAKMTAPTALPNEQTEDYGFGIEIRELKGRRALGHGGGIFGFNTDSIYLPDEDIFVAVFANSDSPAAEPGMVLLKLAALAVGDPFPTFEKAELDPANYEGFYGVYAVEDGERRFFARDGKLFTQRSGGSALETYYAGDGKFFYPGSLSWFELTKADNGTPQMAMHQQGADKAEISLRTGPLPPEPRTVELPREILGRYVGSYKAVMGIAKVALGETGPMTLQLGGQQPVPIKPISETEFQAEGVDAKVVFHLDGSLVKQLVIHQGGRELPAERLPD